MTDGATRRMVEVPLTGGAWLAHATTIRSACDMRER